MKSTLGQKTARILAALMSGKRLTPYEANRIGETTEGTRIIRRLRVDYPIVKEQVAGENYYKYFIEPEWLNEHKESKKSICKKLEGFFEGLFNGGMFEGANV